MFKEVKKCRICRSIHLERVLDLGDQMLTGVFPCNKDLKVTVGPLRLVKCKVEEAGCGLVQLEHSYDLGEMYGENYGYRSGLNSSMVAHLRRKVEKITSKVKLEKGDLVIDIGSNDSTTLKAYPIDLELVGIDPTGVKFQSYYPDHIKLIPNFFSAALVRKEYPNKKAKVVTSFSMFYDLEDPVGFMQEVFDVLDDDGIWVFEQSYMPTMLATNSYDTVCHEHLEFYALKQIKWMTDKIGFRIIDVEFNEVNGGSFSVTVSKANGNFSVVPLVQEILHNEIELELDTLKPYHDFEIRVEKTKKDLIGFIHAAKADGKTISALGASTKGNVLLQYCGLSEDEISYVGEVNIEKYGCYTPGTWLPIISEAELLSKKPDFLIVLPWHFRKFFLDNNKYKKTKLVFPLPNLEIIG